MGKKNRCGPVGQCVLKGIITIPEGWPVNIEVSGKCSLNQEIPEKCSQPGFFIIEIPVRQSSHQMKMPIFGIP